METEPKTRRLWPYVILICLLVIAGFTYAFRYRFDSLTADSDIFSWSSEVQKQKAADLLNKTVLVKDFKAEIYHVDDGDNFWLIAKQYKITIFTVLAFNPELDGLDADPKQALLVPNVKGALHQVQPGDTLESIAKIYETKAEDIRKANTIGWLGLKPLQLLFIPGAKPKELGPKLSEVYKKRSILRAPLNGRYTSLMGTRIDPFTGDASFHNGVDIKADYNTPVSAAAAGTVILAGWNGGFGKCIKIDHHNGYVTLYGHLNSILVHTGQVVKQFQVIGKVGSTGRATGPHLHFTVYYQGKVKNPLEFLW